MYFDVVKRLTSVDMMINNTMLKDSATIAIISMAEQRNHGTVLTRSCTRLGCAKTAI